MADPQGKKGGTMTIRIYTRYRKPITWNSSASPPHPGGGEGKAWLFEHIVNIVSLHAK